MLLKRNTLLVLASIIIIILLFPILTAFGDSTKALYGVALKDKTHVYEETSTESKPLKSYSKGSILKYTKQNDNWFRATVKVNGKWESGYISNSDVETATKDQKTLYGVSLNSPTNIYKNASTSSGNWKSYSEGTLLKYKTFTSEWHEATVSVNGEWKTGYIHKDHVEVPVSKQETLHGVALKASTVIYKKPSTSSGSWKSYKQGSMLKYKTYLNNWYEATVQVNGKWETGYIHKSHVDQPVAKQETIYGIALKSQTPIYKSPSTSSGNWRSYSKGSSLKFKTYLNDWYEATVLVNGNWETGYIHKSHVELPVIDQETIYGFALKTQTPIYKTPSTSSGSWRSYSKGSSLKFKTYLSDWYEATVLVNGNWETGYIHKGHIELPVTDQETIYGFALKTQTPIYKSPTTSSGIWKSYSKGASLKYKTFLKDWYEATVLVNGNWETGYIYKNDVGQNLTTNYGITLNRALDIQSSQEIIITDKYTGSPAYIRAQDVDLTGQGVVTGSTVNIRTTPDLTNNSNVAFQLFVGDSINIVGEINGSTFEGSKVWYKIDHGGKIYYIHSKLASGTGAKVITNNAHVRQSPSTSAHSFGQLNKDAKITIISLGSTWHEIKYNTWRTPTNADIKQYLDPSQNNRYQHLRLDDNINGLTVNQVNKLLNGKGILSGQGQAFINGAKKAKINEFYFIVHALLESGNGNSTLAKGVKYKDKTVYNMFGIGAADKCPLECGAETAYNNGWFSPAEAIEGGAEWVGNQYIYNQDSQNTLYKMKWNPNMDNGRAWKQYATDIGWATKQANLLNNIYNDINNPVLIFDEVKYK